METAIRPITNDGMTAAHAANDDPMFALLVCAEHRGLGIAIYRSSLSNHDGHWRYAAYEQPEEGRPFGIRSGRVIAYEQARYSRNYRPSICGEREAMECLLAKLTGEES